MEIVDLLRDIVAKILYRGKMALAHSLELDSKSEQSSCKEPLREHVLRSVGKKDVVRDFTHHLLQFLQIGCTAIFHTACITEHEITECELLLYIG